MSQISVGVGEAGTGVREALRVGLGVLEGWAAAVLVGVESMAAEATATGVALAGGSSGRTDGRLQASKKNSSSRTAMSTTVRECDIIISAMLYGDDDASGAIVSLARHPHKRCWRPWVLRHRVGGMASPVAWFWVRLRGGS
ncbi:MAG TPA: hypothetical protein VM537_21475 [Anaerolineae bacterium]|nr:hypothetical protein [Anaerolineae bacterium]